MELKDLNNGSVSYADVRGWIMSVVRGDLSPTQLEADQISPMAKIVGVYAHVPELEERFADTTQPDHLREYALAALFHTPQGRKVFAELDADARVRWCGPWVRPMLRLSHELDDEFPPRALVALFIATPMASRMALVRKLAKEVCALHFGADSIRGLLASSLMSAEERDVLVKAVTRE